MYIYIHTYICIYSDLCSQTLTHMHMHTHTTPTHTRICMHACVCVHTYTCIHIHTDPHSTASGHSPPKDRHQSQRLLSNRYEPEGKDRKDQGNIPQGLMVGSEKVIAIRV